MRITVHVHGHWFYCKYTGEVLSWAQTIHGVSSLGGSYAWMQVPCVVLALDNGKIETICLKTDLIWTEIEIVKEEQKLATAPLSGANII